MHILITFDILKYFPMTFASYGIKKAFIQLDEFFVNPKKYRLEPESTANLATLTESSII